MQTIKQNINAADNFTAAWLFEGTEDTRVTTHLENLEKWD